MSQSLQIWIPKDERTCKFDPKSYTDMYLGAPMGHKGAIYVYQPGTDKKVHVIRDYYRMMGFAPDYWPLYSRKQFTWEFYLARSCRW